MTIAAEFAKRILASRYETPPREAAHWAKVGLLDTIGVTIAGSRDKSTRIVTGVTIGSSGRSRCGRQWRRRVLNAMPK